MICPREISPRLRSGALTESRRTVRAFLPASISFTSFGKDNPRGLLLLRSRRATILLATRGHIAPVVLLEIWPSAAPSLEAFALRGTIYVNVRSNILRGAVRSRTNDVVLASLLMHEQSHLLGGNELQALETELGWLMSERASEDVIQE